MNLYRRVGCDCTLDTVMVQSLCQYPDLAIGVGMDQFDVILENQFFVLSEDQPGESAAPPVGAIGLDVEAGLAQAAHACVGFVFQARA